MAIYWGDSNNKSKRLIRAYYGDANNTAREVAKIYAGNSSNKSQLVFTAPVEEFDLRITFGESMNDDYYIYCTIDGQNYSLPCYGGYTFVASSDFGRLIPEGTKVYVEANGSSFDDNIIFGIPEGKYQLNYDIGPYGAYEITVDDYYNVSFNPKYFDVAFLFSSQAEYDYINWSISDTIDYDNYDAGEYTGSNGFASFYEYSYGYSIKHGATITLTGDTTALSSYYYIGANKNAGPLTYSNGGWSVSFQVFGPCEVSVIAYEGDSMPDYGGGDSGDDPYTNIYSITVSNKSSNALDISYWPANEYGPSGYQTTTTLNAGSTYSYSGDIGSSFVIDSTSTSALTYSDTRDVGTPTYDMSNTRITCYPKSSSSSITVKDRSSTKPVIINNEGGWEDISVKYWSNGVYLTGYVNQGETQGFLCDTGTELMMTSWMTPWTDNTVTGATFYQTGSSSTGYNYSTTINTNTDIVIKAGVLVGCINDANYDYPMSYTNGTGSVIYTNLNSGDNLSLFMKKGTYVNFTYYSDEEVPSNAYVTGSVTKSSISKFYVGGKGTLRLLA